MQEKVCEIHKSYKIELYFNFPIYSVLLLLVKEPKRHCTETRN